MKQKRKKSICEMVSENNVAGGVHRVSHINVYQENRRQARQVFVVVAEYSPSFFLK